MLELQVFVPSILNGKKDASASGSLQSYSVYWCIVCLLFHVIAQNLIPEVVYNRKSHAEKLHLEL